MHKRIYTDATIFTGEIGEILIEDEAFRLSTISEDEYVILAYNIDVYYILMEYGGSTIGGKGRVVEMLRSLIAKGIQVSLETELWIAKNA